MKLAIITTHPIQYYAPLFKLLANECELKVFYTWGKSAAESKYDADFGKAIEWDIPLLEGYEYEFLENTSKKPGSHNFFGIKNPEIIEKVSLFNPNAILVYGWCYESHLKVLRFFKHKTPIWFRGDSTLLVEAPFFKRVVRKLLLNWVYSHVDKAFYVGTANKAYFKEYGLKENQLIWAPHAIDNSRFALKKSAEALALRKTLGIDSDKILILFAGKFQHQKNPEFLLQVFEKLDLTKVHLLYVGNGKLEETLKHMATTSVAKHHISFLDFQNQKQMPIIYQACDLYCLCSRSETWGLAVNEAMAAGKAVIVSDQVGCSKDLVINGWNGYIFKSENIEDFSTKLISSLDKEKLIEMGNHSSEKIKDWSFAKQVSLIGKLWK